LLSPVGFKMKKGLPDAVREAALFCPQNSKQAPNFGVAEGLKIGVKWFVDSGLKLFLKSVTRVSRGKHLGSGLRLA
jgi:hypothetical protein